MATRLAPIRVRAARAGDGPRAQAFMRALSPAARYQRFFGPMNELPADMLVRLTRYDPHEAVTLYAVHAPSHGPADGACTDPASADRVESILGVGEYVVDASLRCAEFAVVVADDWRRAGIGTQLLEQLMRTAREAGIDRLEGDILASNEPMLRLARKLGFALRTEPGAALWRRATLALGARYDICLRPASDSMEAR